MNKYLERCIVRLQESDIVTDFPKGRFFVGKQSSYSNLDFPDYNILNVLKKAK